MLNLFILICIYFHLINEIYFYPADGILDSRFIHQMRLPGWVAETVVLHIVRKVSQAGLGWVPLPN